MAHFLNELKKLSNARAENGMMKKTSAKITCKTGEKVKSSPLGRTYTPSTGTFKSPLNRNSADSSFSNAAR